MEIEEINIENKLYPMRLREIKNPPQKLYVIGDTKILNNESISIIGSRCCTPYGAETAKRFAKELAQNEITIVSGMAKGIDTESHLGAIEAEGKTIAILGSGFNHIFPSKKVFEKILQSGGAVITEYEPDVEVSSQGFRDRNRIVAGLSLGILVIEAKVKSGTSITASYAKSFKRKIFCIPHTIEDKAGIGTNRLLKNGAILVTKPEDILKYFNKATKIKKMEINKLIEIPEKYKKVYKELQNEPLNAEQISKKTKCNIIETNTILTMMELEEYIESLPGNYFQIKE